MLIYSYIMKIFKNLFLKIFLILLLQILCVESIKAQEIEQRLNFKSNPTNAEYFWLTYNNFGKTIKSNEFNYQLKIRNKKTDYVFTLSNAYSQNSDLKFGESFIKYNFSEEKFLRLGMYYRDFSTYLNDELSSGSMLISNNAKPMKKIGFVSKKYMKNISFDFGVSHGFFEKNNLYTKAPFLHEKFLYMNLLKKNYEIGVGFVHEAMWAGGTTTYGNLPSDLKSFFKIFLAQDGPLEEGQPHANALGNHLGIWDFYYIKKNNERVLKIYYQHFFEDTSGLRFANKTDGLWGIEIENPLPNTNFLIEYVNTSSCCLDAKYNLPSSYKNDDYYGNYQYISGWRYDRNIIGNPFVNTIEQSDIWVRNLEIVKLFHLGINGEILSNYYQIKAARKTNIKDKINYKITIGRKIKNIIDLNIYIANNDSTSGLGLGISYDITKD